LNGITTHILLSKEDATFGKGKLIGQNSYLWEKGKIVHYYDKTELERLFKDFTKVKIKSLKIKEIHNHLHFHKDLLIWAIKDSNKSAGN